MNLSEVINSRMLTNPVVVRELRQTVKGNIVTLAMNFILAILLIIVSLSFAGNEEFTSGYTNNTMGRELFGGLLIFLMIVIWGVMPLSVYFKFSKERDPDDPDLMFITNMSAGQILLGKYYTAATQMGLYFCSFLPFLLICYMFKGIDVLTMLRAVVQVLVFAGLVAQIAILLAAIPKRKFLLFTFAAAIAALAFFAMILFAEEILPSVYRSYRSRPDPLWAWYWLVVAIILSIYLFILTRAFIMPDTANRAPLPRIFLTVLIIAGYGVCWYISDILHGSNDPLIAWAIFTFMFCIAAMIFSISERDSLSVRVRRTIPGGARRWMYFPFYSGSASGIAWSLGLSVIIWLGVSIIPVINPKMNSSDRDYIMCRSMVFTLPYFFSYCLLVYLITRQFCNDTGRRLTWLWSAIALAAMLFMTIFMREELRYSDNVYVFNPAAVMIFTDVIRGHSAYLGYPEVILTISTLALAILLILSLKFTLPQIRSFKALAEIQHDVSQNTMPGGDVVIDANKEDVKTGCMD